MIKKMLTDLYIKDLVLIHHLHLAFSTGLSAFSGETGAGKSILLDALALSLGKRGDVSLIRKDCDQTSISAVFNIAHHQSVLDLLSELDLLNQETPEELVLRRTINTKGVSKAYINDHPVSVTTLKTIGDQLLEIHGQFDHLFESKTHRKLLDQSILDEIFKENLMTLQTYYKTYKELEKKFNDIKTLEQNHLQQQFLNDSIIQELSTLDLIEDEETLLLDERQKIDELGKAATLLQKAVQLSQDPNFTKELRSLLTKLDAFSMLADIKAPLERIESDLMDVFEVSKDALAHTMDAQHRIEIIDDRLYVLRSKAKKFGVDTSKLLSLLTNAQEQNAIDFDVQKHDIKKQMDATRHDYSFIAESVTQVRKAKARNLESDIQQEFLALKLPHARFQVKIESDPDLLTPFGQDSIEFLIATNKEQYFTSIAKSASGGELARVMLALKCILSKQTGLLTLVFDEIETGVGGAVATAIGQRMSKLSQSIQVLSITHAPQIAALADQNYLVQKSIEEDVTKTSVISLNDHEKTMEIARMLSGESLTDSAIEAAKDLCKQ